MRVGLLSGQPAVTVRHGFDLLTEIKNNSAQVRLKPYICISPTLRCSSYDVNHFSKAAATNLLRSDLVLLFLEGARDRGANHHAGGGVV